MMKFLNLPLILTLLTLCSFGQKLPALARFSMPGHSNQPFPEDFKNFYNSPKTLFLKEVQEANVYKRK